VETNKNSKNWRRLGQTHKSSHGHAPEPAKRNNNIKGAKVDEHNKGGKASTWPSRRQSIRPKRSAINMTAEAKHPQEQNSSKVSTNEQKGDKHSHDQYNRFCNRKRSI